MQSAITPLAHHSTLAFLIAFIAWLAVFLPVRLRKYVDLDEGVVLPLTLKRDRLGLLQYFPVLVYIAYILLAAAWMFYQILTGHIASPAATHPAADIAAIVVALSLTALALSAVVEILFSFFNETRYVFETEGLEIRIDNKIKAVQWAQISNVEVVKVGRYGSGIKITTSPNRDNLILPGDLRAAPGPVSAGDVCDLIGLRVINKRIRL